MQERFKLVDGEVTDTLKIISNAKLERLIEYHDGKLSIGKMNDWYSVGLGDNKEMKMIALLLLNPDGYMPRKLREAKSLIDTIHAMYCIDVVNAISFKTREGVYRHDFICADIRIKIIEEDNKFIKAEFMPTVDYGNNQGRNK